MSALSEPQSPIRQRFEGEAEAESSKSVNDKEGTPEALSGDEHSDQEQEDVQDDVSGDGLDPDGFAGPSGKIVKPLTPEALAAFNAAQERAGVVYISRIPPGMRPSKVRHLMSTYGEVGRVYLQQEGMCMPFILRCR